MEVFYTYCSENYKEEPKKDLKEGNLKEEKKKKSLVPIDLLA